VVKTDGDSMFESAYFILKKGSVAGRCDIVREANKIIGADYGKRHRSRREIVRSAICLGVGVLVGALVSVAVMLILR
jgi:hypothetical protein